MQYLPKLQEAVLIKRYKRFLADVRKSDGELLTLHCPNTGSMKNCQPQGARIWYSTSANPKRKYPHTWEFVEVDHEHIVGINSAKANHLVREAIEEGSLSGLLGYTQIRPEVKYGENSRIDFLLSGHVTANDCYVEVKNVSLGVGGSLAKFPDAVTTRGQKHLQELMNVRQQGYRAVLLFCVQHTGINTVAPADDIDPRYGELLREAAAKGVEVMAAVCHIDPAQSLIELRREIAVDLS